MGHYIGQLLETWNNYGREAAAFLNIGQLETTVAKRPLSWRQLASIMGHFIGQLEITRAAQRPPSFFIQATATNHGSFLNYGREAAAFFNWATVSINLSLYWTTGNNYGRAAAAFFLTTTAAQRSPFYCAIGNFGREAAVFLNWATGINNGSLYWTTGNN